MSDSTVRLDTAASAEQQEGGFLRELGLWDSTMIVAGSMIGSGIFIVPAEIGRLVGSSGWMLAVWVFTGLLVMAAALSYGELAAMMPKAGGQYIYLRQAYSPLWGFLYGWTLFLVIQTGTIAAVAIGFAKFVGVLLPAVSPEAWIVQPVNLSSGYAIGLSVQQLVGIALVVGLTALNTRGVRLGKLVQNTFTSAKALSLIGLVLIVVLAGMSSDVIRQNFSRPWSPQGVSVVAAPLSFLRDTSATAGVWGLLVAFCVAQVGSVFSAEAWTNVTFIAGEVKQPRRNLPLALALGTGLVTTLYVLVNVAYLLVLPVAEIQNAPQDRVGTACLSAIMGSTGAVIMAVAIIVSTTGCNNGLILSGARVYCAMAKDGLFFHSVGRLNRHHVPAAALVFQCVWACLLILPQTRLYDPATGAESYGNLYGNLLEYVVTSVLVFYVLTIAGVFVLRRRQPDAPRPYRAFGYPLVPALYILGASTIIVILALYRTQTTWPGLVIVLTGVPAYWLWKALGRTGSQG